MAYDPHADVKAAIAVSEHVLAACDDRFVKLDRDVLQRLESAAERMLVNEEALIDIEFYCAEPGARKQDFVWNPREICQTVAFIAAEFRRLKASTK